MGMASQFNHATECQLVGITRSHRPDGVLVKLRRDATLRYDYCSYHLVFPDTARHPLNRLQCIAETDVVKQFIIGLQGVI